VTVRWGLLSTVAIGELAVASTRDSARARFVAVASRDGRRARRFAERHGLPSGYGSYEQLLGSSEVDAVYVALPVSMHAEWTVAAPGKHVLCEKPFAATAAEAAAAFPVGGCVGAGPGRGPTVGPDDGGTAVSPRLRVGLAGLGPGTGCR
jgi:predicted dehydrogenase